MTWLTSGTSWSKERSLCYFIYFRKLLKWDTSVAEMPTFLAKLFGKGTKPLIFRIINCIFFFVFLFRVSKFIQEEVKSRLNSGYACYYSVQNLLSSRLLFEIVKIRIYKITIYLWFCMGVKLGLCNYGNAHTVRVFENRVKVKVYLCLTN
jgi:hypothetical protein